jgi:hypothetical protein
MFNVRCSILKIYIPLIIIICLLSSCKNEVKPIVFKTESITDNFETNSTVSFDRVADNDEISNAINTTLQNQIIASIPNSENQNTINDAVKAFDKDYNAFKTDFPDSAQVWELHIETEVIYQSSQVITMVLNVYSDTGGAHGNDSIQLLNFNPETGKLYSIAEIINDLEGFKSLAESHFLNELKNESETISISEFFFGKSFQLPDNIGFSEDGFIMLYNVYEIASYNQGNTEFVIPFEEANPYLKIN